MFRTYFVKYEHFIKLMNGLHSALDFNSYKAKSKALTKNLLTVGPGLMCQHSLSKVLNTEMLACSLELKTLLIILWVPTY